MGDRGGGGVGGGGSGGGAPGGITFPMASAPAGASAAQALQGGGRAGEKPRSAPSLYRFLCFHSNSTARATPATLERTDPPPAPLARLHAGGYPCAPVRGHHLLEIPRRLLQEAREEGLVVALPLSREVGHACPDLEEAAHVAAGSGSHLL
eukprot:scaffold31485_cov57-Phaeocystis_antarctica.AAC.7